MRPHVGEFAEFFGATWSRLYRTTYVVAGDHARTEHALSNAFAQAYAGWRQICDEDDPEDYVRRVATDTALREGHQHDIGLVNELDVVLVPPGDLEAVVTDGRSLQRRRARFTTVLVVGLALATVATFALFRSGDRVDDSPWGTWTEIAASPLTPRSGAIGLWAGGEVAFWGGVVSKCGYDQCREQRARGASYNLMTKVWRTLPPAPFQFSRRTPHAVVGDELIIVESPHRWWSFDASLNRWTALPPPLQPTVNARVASSETLVYAAGLGLGDPVQVFDTTTRAWSAFPLSPHDPRLAERRLVATQAGVLALGRVFGESPDGTSASFRLEHFDGATWSRVGDRVSWVDRCCQHWTGSRLVLPESAGETQRALEDLGIPAVTLPALPDPPAAEPFTDTPTEVWEPDADAGPLMARGGFIYDDRDETFAVVHRPPGAPGGADSAVWVDGSLWVLESLSASVDSASAQRTSSRVWVYTERDTR